MAGRGREQQPLLHANSFDVESAAGSRYVPGSSNSISPNEKRRDHLASFETGFPALVDDGMLHQTASRRASVDPCSKAKKTTIGLARFLSNCGVSFTLLMSAIGAGTLSVPYTFLLLSPTEAVVTLCLVGAAMAFTADIILRVHVAVAAKSGNEEMRETYQELAVYASGPRLARVVGFLTAFAVFGACVGCVRVVRDMAPTLVSIFYLSHGATFDQLAPETQHVYVNNAVWLIFMIVILPLGFFKKISALRFSSYLGFAFSLYLVGAVAYRAMFGADGDTTASVVPAAGIPQVSGSSFTRLSEAIGIYNFTFMLHLNVIPLLAQLVVNTSSDSGEAALRRAERKMHYNVYGAVFVCVLLQHPAQSGARSDHGSASDRDSVHDFILVPASIPSAALSRTGNAGVRRESDVMDSSRRLGRAARHPNICCHACSGHPSRVFLRGVEHFAAAVLLDADDLLRATVPMARLTRRKIAALGIARPPGRRDGLLHSGHSAAHLQTPRCRHEAAGDRRPSHHGAGREEHECSGDHEGSTDTDPIGIACEATAQRSRRAILPSAYSCVYMIAYVHTGRSLICGVQFRVMVSILIALVVSFVGDEELSKPVETSTKAPFLKKALVFFTGSAPRKLDVVASTTPRFALQSFGGDEIGSAKTPSNGFPPPTSVDKITPEVTARISTSDSGPGNLFKRDRNKFERGEGKLCKPGLLDTKISTEKVHDAESCQKQLDKENVIRGSSSGGLPLGGKMRALNTKFTSGTLSFTAKADGQAALTTKPPLLKKVFSFKPQAESSKLTALSKDTTGEKLALTPRDGTKRSFSIEEKSATTGTTSEPFGVLEEGKAYRGCSFASAKPAMSNFTPSSRSFGKLSKENIKKFNQSEAEFITSDDEKFLVSENDQVSENGDAAEDDNISLRIKSIQDFINQTSKDESSAEDQILDMNVTIGDCLLDILTDIIAEEGGIGLHEICTESGVDCDFLSDPMETQVMDDE
ncbi:Amino acid/auxin permease, partial [Globisporangium splendens]